MSCVYMHTHLARINHSVDLRPHDFNVKANMQARIVPVHVGFSPQGATGITSRHDCNIVGLVLDSWKFYTRLSMTDILTNKLLPSHVTLLSSALTNMPIGNIHA